jgi:tRNA A37 threonylcarbamoyladenosine dehydratase
MDQFSRTERLLGTEAMQRLKGAHVAVFGLGGVGSYAAEALARSALGTLTLVDMDTVCISNVNRQLVASLKTVGRKKTEVMRERILDINPDAEVFCCDLFYSEENAGAIDFTGMDYIVDAIDTVASKITLICRAQAAGIPVISSMGAGNKLDPTRFETADIYKTSVCPLAKVMRRELRARGVAALKVVYSREEPIKPVEDIEIRAECTYKRRPPGSVSFVPPAAGLILAAEVVRDIAGQKE